MQAAIHTLELNETRIKKAPKYTLVKNNQKILNKKENKSWGCKRKWGKIE